MCSPSLCKTQLQLLPEKMPSHPPQWATPCYIVAPIVLHQLVLNTAHSPCPREDTFSSTSKGSLSTSLSSASHGQSVAVSRSFSNTLEHLQSPRHPPDHVTTTSGGPKPFTMQCTRACTVHSGNEEAVLMRFSRRFGSHFHWEATRGVLLDPMGVG